MKRRDAIKTAIGSLLGFLAAPFVAKAVKPMAPVVGVKGDPVVLNGVEIQWIECMDGSRSSEPTSAEGRRLIAALKRQRRQIQREYSAYLEKLLWETSP